MTQTRAFFLCCRLAPAALGLLAVLAAPAHAQLELDGGGLTLVQEGPAVANAGDPVPTNLSIGATAFASGSLGEEYGLTYHFIENLNDGAYGNAFSWIGGDPEFNPYDDAFAGIDLGNTAVAHIQSIAFGRSNVLGGDNCNAGTVCTDRHLGLYTLQYTQVARPSNNLDLSTTGNALTGWVDIGTLDYVASDGPGTNFNNTWQRHRFNFTPVSATGIRLVVPVTGMNGGTAIDEIELYDTAGPYVPPPPAPDVVDIHPVAPYSITWNGNDGEHFDEEIPPDGAIVPDNYCARIQQSDTVYEQRLGTAVGHRIPCRSERQRWPVWQFQQLDRRGYESVRAGSVCRRGPGRTGLDHQHRLGTGQRKRCLGRQFRRIRRLRRPVRRPINGNVHTAIHAR